MNDPWYLAVCIQCHGGLRNFVENPNQFMPMPFEDNDARTSWVNAHMEGTRHSVLLMDQYENPDQGGEASGV